MFTSHDLSVLQAAHIQYLVSEQSAMIELFTKYGLLSDEELRGKISAIFEATRISVENVLDPGQLGIWREWDSKLDAPKDEKIKVRRRVIHAR